MRLKFSFALGDRNGTKMLTFFWAFIAIGCVTACLIALLWHLFFSSRELRRQKIKQLGSRQCLSSMEFFDRFYASAGLPKELVIDVLERLGKALELPPGLLRPDDRFALELAPPKGWGLMDDRLDLYDAFRELGKQYDLKGDLSRLASIDEVIRAVGESVDARL
ncbi:MAG: hypothetical protein HY234_14490 [Acidobacteria bacterium]|nr:hypothetical protein [Acidobacteriota bacterium]